MTNRKALIATFLQNAGWGNAARAVLAGDASARRYDRLTDPVTGQTAVFMDAPADQGEDIRPFTQIAGHLSQRGFAAPEILAGDPVNGFVLLEDLGDGLYARLCASTPDLETRLYSAAVDVLVALHSAPPPADLPPYDLPTYRREARLLTDYYLPAVTGSPTPDSLQNQFDTLITTACETLANTAPVFVLRDYHAENLLWLPDREGLKKVGLLDFQDALAGHPAYDLVSLLEDARRDTSKALQAAMITRYLAATGLPEVPFRQAYAILGAQRNLKIIGIFSRLCIRDHKPMYTELIPRVWAHLMRDLAHPALSELADFIAINVPNPTPENLEKIRRACP